MQKAILVFFAALVFISGPLFAQSDDTESNADVIAPPEAIIPTAPAQSAVADGGFGDLFAGKHYPLTLRLKDLSANWTRLTISSPTASVLIGATFPVTYTKGLLTSAGGQTFLVAYEPKLRPYDLADLIHHKTPLLPQKLTPDTVIGLTFINVHDLGKLSAITPFDLVRETSQPDGPNADEDTKVSIKEEPPPTGLKAAEIQSLSNLTQLATGIMKYCQDTDQKLPIMMPESRFHDETISYIRSEPVYLDPHSMVPYQLNEKLSGKFIVDFAYPGTYPLAWEPRPYPDNTRAILFLDGHAKRVKEAEWRKIKANYHILDSAPSGPVLAR